MKHCIIVKYNDTVTDKAALLEEIKTLFAPCAHIPGVHGLLFCPTATDFPNRYDLMIALDMDREALEAFNASEVHHVWKRDYAKYLASKAIFDGDF